MTTSNQTMLPGVALCSPFAQGDLDNLCGLYAAVNALHLTSAPIRPFKLAEAKQVLHDTGIAYLHRRRWLSDAIIDGMSLRRQRAVTLHMAKAAARATGLRFVAVPLVPGGSKLTAGAALQLLAERIAGGTAIIACLENTLWHYSVISGVSDSRLYLFDSIGLHWIERRSLGVLGKSTEARHSISLASLIAVGVAST